MALLATPFLITVTPMPEEASFTQGNHVPTAVGVLADEACEEIRRAAHAADRVAPPAGLCEDLHRAVERAAVRSADSMAALRLTVARFTIALRNDGASPEAILIALKSVINSRTFPVTPQGRDGHGEELRQLISTWSIQEYFEERHA